MAPAAGNIHFLILRFSSATRKLIGSIQGQFAYVQGAQNANVYPMSTLWFETCPANETWILREFMIINAGYALITFELKVAGVDVFPWGAKGHYSTYSKDYVQNVNSLIPGGAKIYLRLQDATA